MMRRALGLCVFGGVTFGLLSPPARAEGAAASAGKAAAASEAGPKELSADEVRKLQEEMKSSDALTVDFVQSTKGALSAARGGRVRKREGRAVLAKPNSVLWMFETPRQQHMLFDGTHYFEYDPESGTANRFTVTGPQSYEVRSIVDMVLNFDTLLKRYEFVKAVRDGDTVTIDLKPRSVQDITAVTLKLAVKEAYVSYLKWDTADGKSIAHEFRNPSRKAIAETTFTLPKGVKIRDTN